MQLELNDDEAFALRQLLEGSLGELSAEIADTDNPRFGRDLRAHRDALRAILLRLGGGSD